MSPTLSISIAVVGTAVIVAVLVRKSGKDSNAALADPDLDADGDPAEVGEDDPPQSGADDAR